MPGSTSLTGSFFWLFQETTRGWRARSSSCARWATISSRSISPPVWSSSYRGSPSGSIGVRPPPGSASGSPLCSPWPPSWRRRTRRCQKSPTSSRSTSTWVRASSWCSLRYWVSQKSVTCRYNFRYNTVTFRYRIRQRGLHGKTDTNAKEPVSSVAKDGRAEEKRGYEC